MQVKLPLPKPDIIDEIGIISFNDLIDKFFWVCVDLLRYAEDVTGYSYELINVAIFVVLQPLLIVIFALLWISSKWQNKAHTERLAKSNAKYKNQAYQDSVDVLRGVRR